MATKLQKEYIEAKLIYETAKEKLSELKEKLLETDFESVEIEGITISKQTRKSYKYLGDISILEKKYPKFIEKKPKNLKTLYEVDPEGIERSVTEMLVVKGL